MPLPTIPDTYRCAVHQQMGVIEIYNVINVNSDGTDTPFQIGEAIARAWVTSGSFRGIQSGDVNYRDVTVQPLDGVSAGTVVPWPSGSDNTGGGAGAGAPPNVACIFTLRTGLAGPSGRGRIYLPGVRVALMVDENTRWSLSDSGFAAAGQEFSDAVNAELDSGFLVVASYEHSTAAAVNAVQLRGYIGTQRRRAA